MRLKEYLEEKPLFYKEIDYSRMPRAYESIKKCLKLPKIVQIVGTNGKGSTGRFLAQMLMQQNLSVGHYTSPHIFKFNERIWINGRDINDEELEQTHQELQEILDDEFLKTLSYFEYTSFLAIMFFSTRCDYIVLEAGLGGEYDATTVFPKNLSIITPIGYDHSSFLGGSIDDIATTKINSINTTTILSKQYHSCVYNIAEKISNEKKIKLLFAEEVLDDDEIDRIKKIVKKNHLPDFQNINLQSALSAVKTLGFDMDLSTIDVTAMPGRCQKISKNITVDVGHNEMAAKVLVEHFKNRKVILLYNSFKDKKYSKIVKILKPIIKKVEIIDIENEREMATSEIVETCKKENISCSKFQKLDMREEYLVFGSFVVVENFLKVYKER